MKPWEETWECSPNYLIGGTWVHRSGEDPGEALGCAVADMTKSEAHAKLVAAAPDLVRALLAVEWTIDEAKVFCSACGIPRTPDGKHRPDCIIDAALRKAGVR